MSAFARAPSGNPVYEIIHKIGDILSGYDTVLIKDFTNPSIYVTGDDVRIHITTSLDSNYDLTVIVLQMINGSLIKVSFLITIGVDIIVTFVNDEFLDAPHTIAQYDEEIGMVFDDSADDDASIIIASQQDLFDSLLCLNSIN